MGNAYVIKRKPFLYKLGAKIFRWLVLSNKVVEYEKWSKVIETDKLGQLQGLKTAYQKMEEIE